MQPIIVLYPLELIHLDFLTLGGKADDHKSVNILIAMDHFTNMHKHMLHLKKQQWWLHKPYRGISWYIVDGLKRFSLIKESLLRIILFENYVN